MVQKQTAGHEHLGEFAPKFAELNDDVLFGEVWSREDKMSAHDRSLITVSSLLTQGAPQFDLNEVLIKLKQSFGIKTLALCGGARIDGVFLKQHLVDKISLVVAPRVGGDNKIKSAFDTAGDLIQDQFAIDEVTKLSDGGVHLIFRKQ